MTSGKGGSGEEVSHFWDHMVDAIQRRKRKEKTKEKKEMRKREKRENENEMKWRANKGRSALDKGEKEICNGSIMVV